MIPVKRLTQGILQGAEAINRASSTGGGSGFLPLLLLADTDTGNIQQTFTGVGIGNATDITGSSATISLNRAGFLFIAMQVIGAVTAGTDFSYVYIDLDGTKLTFNCVWGDGPKGYSCQTAIAFPLASAGSHTIKVRGYVGAGGTTGIVVEARTYVNALSA